MDRVRDSIHVVYYQIKCFWQKLSIPLLLLFSPGLVMAGEYSVSLLPNQVFTTQESAEAAMRAVSVQASYLQRTGIISQTPTDVVYSYAVPDQPPTIWWLANIGNTGPGPFGGTTEPGGNCESCLQASGGFHWTGVLTASGASFGCQFTQRDGSVQNNGCIVSPYPACPEGFALMIGYATCINQITATITERIVCPVPDLTPVENIPPNGPDVLPLTLELERARGVNILALTPETETARQCLIGKASGIGVTVITTSGTRTIAYQKHFIELWDKMIAHNEYKKKPVLWEVCRSRREKVIAEKGCSSSQGCVGACTPGSHCIRYRPAIRSDHPNGKAFDISKASIDGIKTNLALYGPPQPISGWLASPPPCNLRWGGAFQDEVHFELGQ